METTRRNFIVGTGAAVAAAGVPKFASAEEAEIEKTIAETKYIDIHAHCTEDPLPPAAAADKQPLPVAEQLLGFYDAMNVEKGVVLSLCNPENFIGGMSTEMILRVCKAHPDRLIPSVGIDPRCLGNHVVNDKFGYIFSWYRDKGCKVCGEVCANLHFLDPVMQSVIVGL